MIASWPVVLAGGQGGSTFFAFLPFILIFLIIYLLMIRPQTKKQKELQKMIASLQKGDKIITVGGIVGTVAGIRENDGLIILKVADNVKLEVTKSAVAKKLGSK